MSKGVDGGGKGGGMEPRLVSLSKRMSWLLRHGIVEAGISMAEDGTVAVADMLALKQFRCAILRCLPFFYRFALPYIISLFIHDSLAALLSIHQPVYLSAMNLEPL